MTNQDLTNDQLSAAAALADAWSSRELILQCAPRFDTATLEAVSGLFAAAGRQVTGRMWIAGGFGSPDLIEAAQNDTTELGQDSATTAAGDLTMLLAYRDLAGDVAPRLNCGEELDALLAYLHAVERPEVAQLWEAAHIAGDDDPDDDHYQQYRSGAHHAALGR